MDVKPRRFLIGAGPKRDYHAVRQSVTGDSPHRPSRRRLVAIRDPVRKSHFGHLPDVARRGLRWFRRGQINIEKLFGAAFERAELSTFVQFLSGDSVLFETSSRKPFNDDIAREQGAYLDFDFTVAMGPVAATYTSRATGLPGQITLVGLILTVLATALTRQSQVVAARNRDLESAAATLDRQERRYRNLIDKLDYGFVVTDNDLKTSVPGVFAAGDIRSKLLRQISTAVGEGASAAFAAERYLENVT